MGAVVFGAYVSSEVSMVRSNGYLASIGTKLLQLRGSDWVRKCDEFLRTPQYIIAISALTAVSNLLSLDLFLYTIYILIGLFVCLLGRDLLGIMPMVVLGYISPSPSNNPGSASNTGSIFYPENGGIYILVIASILVIALVYRLVTDPQIGGQAFLKAERKLTNGMLILGAAYLLSGLGIEQYGQIWQKNLLFSFLQLVAIFGMYFLFAGAVRWEEVSKDHLAWIGMCAGLVVVPQLAENYLSGRIFMEGTGTIDRELIYAGWGMHNNMGAIMAMMLPFPFYLARHHKSGWVFNILATILMVSVVLSCSRTSIMVGAAVYVLCAVLLLRRKDQRKQNVRIYLLAVLCAVALSIVFFNKLKDIFDLFFEELFIVSQRDNLFRYGMKQFMGAPVFGGSFFPQGEYVPWDWSTSAAFSSFFPPRWHNTLVQLGASCGIIGLISYSIHRLETIGLFLKDRSVEKWYIAFSIIVLLTCSLLDCHFFNIGPVLFYSMALAFAEKIHRSHI